MDSGTGGKRYGNGRNDDKGCKWRGAGESHDRSSPEETRHIECVGIHIRMSVLNLVKFVLSFMRRKLRHIKFIFVSLVHFNVKPSSLYSSSQYHIAFSASILYISSLFIVLLCVVAVDFSQ